MEHLTFYIDLQNGDSGFRLGESAYLIESDDPQIQMAAAAIEAAVGPTCMIDAIRTSLRKGSTIHDRLLSALALQGHDKAGWHDVIAEINSVSVNGGPRLLNDDGFLGEDDLSHLMRIQLSRGEYGPSMEFIE